MREYTGAVVERFLRSLKDIRYMLEGGGGTISPDNYYIRTPPGKKMKRELPLGMYPNDPRPWPFMEPLHATPPFDGKAKAKAIQELHCGLIDIEAALERTDRFGRFLLSDDDYQLIMKYHIEQEYTLDELALERGVTSRGSMQKRIQRAVLRLADILEQRYET